MSAGVEAFERLRGTCNPRSFVARATKTQLGRFVSHERPGHDDRFAATQLPFGGSDARGYLGSGLTRGEPGSVTAAARLRRMDLQKATGYGRRSLPGW